MMDSKEHITTLCALGTLGAAATGFAFAIEEPVFHLTRPGKRKWPGSSGQSWSLSSVDPTVLGRSVSQPHTPTLTALPPFPAISNNTRTLLPSATKRNISGWDDLSHDIPSSRGSSTSRRSILRFKTSHSKNNTEKRESSTSSSWLKRLSSLSSNSGSYTSSLRAQEIDPPNTHPSLPQRSVSAVTSVPNKLVKRSISHRGLSHEEAKGQVFRRPATSHQRSQTFKEILSRPLSRGPELPESLIESSDSSPPSTSASQHPAWRAYFESSFPRKRRKSESVVDSSQIRTIRLGTQSNPTMVLGHNMSGLENSWIPATSKSANLPKPLTTIEPRKSRYSLASRRTHSRRRNLTDPSVQLTRASANGTFSSIVTPGTGFSTSGISPLDASIISGQMNSSPPPLSYDHSVEHQNSTTVSDPLTVGSDVDTRMFSDEDSLTFQSDTAYDSIATRTTNASYNGQNESKLSTIFAARTSDEVAVSPELWHGFPAREIDHANSDRSLQEYGGDFEADDMDTAVTSDYRIVPVRQTCDIWASTPPRAASPDAESFSITPIPPKANRMELYSSSPLLPSISGARVYEDVGAMLEDMQLDEDDEVNWSPQGKASSNAGVNNSSANQGTSIPDETYHPLIARFRESEGHKIQVNGKQLKPSIFDWSEHQHINGFSRPKTVHGKQSNGDRSRSSGRKGPPQLHFRSQSVPVNRDGPIEDVQVPSKYPTWRLGHTQVSEEWSDDFEFEDVIEGLKTPNVVPPNDHPNPRDSIRSVKIPQSIIDRQSSVHLQFGQVQEFMALVEGLKELRSRGGELQLLNGPSKHLWEEAEAIVNLATINDDEHEHIAPSPNSSDPFADPAPQPNRARSNTSSTARGRRLTASNKRSISNMSTLAMQSRTRGESLAQARHLLQNMHQTRVAPDSSPREIEIYHQKKVQFDTQDLKDLVDRSGVITRALKEEVRKAEGVSISPQKTPLPTKGNYLSEMFRAPEPQSVSPCPPFRKPGLPKSHSANSYLESDTRQYTGPFDSPLTFTAIVQAQFPTPTSSITT